MIVFFFSALKEMDVRGGGWESGWQCGWKGVDMEPVYGSAFRRLYYYASVMLKPANMEFGQQMNLILLARFSLKRACEAQSEVCE